MENGHSRVCGFFRFFSVAALFPRPAPTREKKKEKMSAAKMARQEKKMSAPLCGPKALDLLDTKRRAANGRGRMQRPVPSPQKIDQPSKKTAARTRAPKDTHTKTGPSLYLLSFFCPNKKEDPRFPENRQKRLVVYGIMLPQEKKETEAELVAPQQLF